MAVAAAVVPCASRGDLLAQADTQPPAVVRQSPPAGTNGVVPTINVTATFSEPVQAASVTFVLKDPNNVTVPSAVSTTRRVGRRGSIQLPRCSSDLAYTATLSATDIAGNSLATPAIWAFTTADVGFHESTVLSGLIEPTAVQFSPDGRVFVAEKSGLIKVFDSLSSTTPTVFADLRTNVHDYGNRGLSGLALDPGFLMGRPYVYVLYSYDGPINGVAPRLGSCRAVHWIPVPT